MYRPHSRSQDSLSIMCCIVNMGHTFPASSGWRRNMGWVWRWTGFTFLSFTWSQAWMDDDAGCGCCRTKSMVWWWYKYENCEDSQEENWEMHARYTSFPVFEWGACMTGLWSPFISPFLRLCIVLLPLRHQACQYGGTSLAVWPEINHSLAINRPLTAPPFSLFLRWCWGLWIFFFFFFERGGIDCHYCRSISCSPASSRRSYEVFFCIFDTHGFLFRHGRRFRICPKPEPPSLFPQWWDVRVCISRAGPHKMWYSELDRSVNVPLVRSFVRSFDLCFGHLWLEGPAPFCDMIRHDMAWFSLVKQLHCIALHCYVREETRPGWEMDITYSSVFTRSCLNEQVIMSRRYFQLFLSLCFLGGRGGGNVCIHDRGCCYLTYCIYQVGTYVPWVLYELITKEGV